MDRLLKIDEVSQLTGLSVGTLYHFVSQHRIPVVRISRRCLRFRQAELQEWLESLGCKTTKYEDRRMYETKAKETKCS